MSGNGLGLGGWRVDIDQRSFGTTSAVNGFTVHVTGRNPRGERMPIFSDGGDPTALDQALPGDPQARLEGTPGPAVPRTSADRAWCAESLPGDRYEREARMTDRV